VLIFSIHEMTVQNILCFILSYALEKNSDIPTRPLFFSVYLILPAAL
jgi:hypothetical protein